MSEAKAWLGALQTVMSLHDSAYSPVFEDVPEPSSTRGARGSYPVAQMKLDCHRRPAGLDASPSTPSPVSGRRPTGYIFGVAVRIGVTTWVEVMTCPRGTSPHL